MRTRRQAPAAPGFTFMEVMTALLLMAMVIGIVLNIARTSLQLSKSIIEKQNEGMKQQAFFDLLGRRFSSLPGNTRMDVTIDDGAQPVLSNMTLQNVPMSFTWGGEDRLAKAVQLSTVLRRNGYLDVVLRYYEDEILEGSASTFGSTAGGDEEPFAEIVLLEDVAYFEWRLLNAATMEWQYEWADRARLPLQLELQMATGATGKPVRYVFWLPPKLNPEQVMRQTGQSRGNEANQPGEPATGQPGEIRVEAGQVHGGQAGGEGGSQ